jgi:hypothetical protein
MSRRSISSMLLAGTLLLVIAMPAGASGPAPRLLRFDDTTRFAVRPATLSFGADGGVLVFGPGVTRADVHAGRDGHIRWAYWKKASASGVGTVWINQCRPNCAAGHYTSHPVVVVAGLAVNGRYTRLSLSYGAGSHATVQRYDLKRFGRFYGWQ